MHNQQERPVDRMVRVIGDLDIGIKRRRFRVERSLSIIELQTSRHIGQSNKVNFDIVLDRRCNEACPDRRVEQSISRFDAGDSDSGLSIVIVVNQSENKIGRGAFRDMRKIDSHRLPLRNRVDSGRSGFVFSHVKESISIAVDRVDQ